jgi:hypothetical protein
MSDDHGANLSRLSSMRYHSDNSGGGGGGGGGGSGGVFMDLGAEADMIQSLTHALEQAGLANMFPPFYILGSIQKAFQGQALSLQVLSAAFDALGRLPSIGAALPKIASIIGKGKAGGPGH